MDITIRKATYKDLDTILGFEQGVINAERVFDSTLKANNAIYYDLENMLIAPNIELIVAEYNNKVIASGYARIENAKPYLNHAQHAYLGFMYVVPDFRGKGINLMIINYLNKWAALNGINEIRLDVYFENLPAIRAYEKAGFKSHMIEMRMDIG